MSRITLKRRISQEVIHMRVIFQPRMCSLGRGEVQEPFQNLEGFLLVTRFNCHKITKLKNEAANLMPQRAVLPVNCTADQKGLLLSAEKAPQLFDPFLR